MEITSGVLESAIRAARDLRDFYSFSQGQMLQWCITGLLFVYRWYPGSARKVSVKARTAIKNMLTSAAVVGCSVYLYFFITAPSHIQVDELRKELNNVASVEPRDSLRRRTVRLADQIDAFHGERAASHPPYTNGEENASPSQKRINDASIRYDRATENLCLQKFKEEMIGIPRELLTKGLDVKFLDQVSPTRCLSEQETELLRYLAYRLDGNDNLVRF